MPLTFVDPAIGETPWGGDLNAILDAIKTWSQAPDATAAPSIAPLPTSPTIAGGAVGTATDFLALESHQHQSPGGFAARTSNLTLSSSIVETTLLQSGASPANWLAAGTTLRVHLQGTIQVQATSGTLTFKVYMGSGAATVLSGQPQMPNQVGAAGPVGFELDYSIQTQTIAAGGVVTSGGRLSINFGTFLNTMSVANTTTVDTTVAQTFKITGQWATSSATNILIVTQAWFELVKM